MHDIQNDFRQAMENQGINCQIPIIADGQIHRFATGKAHRKNGWYVCHGQHGAFGDWEKGVSAKWSTLGKFNVNPSIVRQQIRKQKAEQLEHYQKTSHEIREEWQHFDTAGYSPYLKRKQVQAYGVKFNNDAIVIPLRDINGKLWSYQTVSNKGKWFRKGGKVKGCFHVIGDLPQKGHIYIAEGYATAATVHIATNHSAIVAFNTGNLEQVVRLLTNRYPNLFITIAADDDRWKERNIGRETAYHLADEYGCNVVFPQFHITDSFPTDFNDLHVLEGIEIVTRQLELHYV